LWGSIPCPATKADGWSDWCTSAKRIEVGSTPTSASFYKYYIGVIMAEWPGVLGKVDKVSPGKWKATVQTTVNGVRLEAEATSNSSSKAENSARSKLGRKVKAEKRRQGK
jgi:hypothetical protein